MHTPHFPIDVITAAKAAFAFRLFSSPRDMLIVPIYTFRADLEYVQAFMCSHTGPKSLPS